MDKQQATSIKLEALRQLGKMLEVTPRAAGGSYGGRKRIDGTRALPSIGTPPTLAEMGLELEQLEREEAKKRQGTRTDLQHSAKFAEGSKGDTRDRVGEMVGMSGKNNKHPR